MIFLNLLYQHIHQEKIFHQIGDNNAVMLPLISPVAKVYKIDEAVKLNVEKFPDAMKDIN